MLDTQIAAHKAVSPKLRDLVMEHMSAGVYRARTADEIATAVG